jgi:type I restriction enzyme M protein
MKTTKKVSNDGGSQPVSAELTINGLEGWLWDAACSIRGAVDAPKFKDYILPLIFVKRLSDVFDDEIDRLAEKFGDRETALELAAHDHSLVRFYIPPEASWSEVRKLTTKIGQRLTEIIRAITKANPPLQGVIDIVDFNATVSGQRIIEEARLSSLIEILSRHPLGLKDVEADILGRAYEYLLRKFAEGQGSSAGEFFTPQEVGWLIARLLRPAEGMSIYDPACGSAGLLVKAELVVKEASPKVKRPLRLFGQELNHITYAIAKMNMIIHDMEGEVAIGDTLRNAKFLSGPKLKRFDLVAANPMWNQDGYSTEFYDADPYGRFEFGHPPASSADWGWAQHMLASLGDDGRAVVVLDTGAASRGSGGDSGNKEREIRRAFVDRDLVEGVVLLPENLFYNTSAPGILLALNKKKPQRLAGKVLVINASGEFEKGRPKNFIPAASIAKIADSFVAGTDVTSFVRVVSNDEIAKNDYNISPSRYVSANGEVAVIPVEEAFEQLRKAEAERHAADEEFVKSMDRLGLGSLGG